VELGPQEQQGDSYESKRVIYDIRCKTEYGPMTIEMQFGEREEFSHRMVYYASRAVSNCVKKGTDDYTLPEIYVIGIANYILPEVTSNENIINKYALINKEDGKTLLNNTLNFVTVELPKFIKDEENLTSWTDIMIFLIKNMGLLKSRPEKLADKNLDKLFERSMFANMETEAQRRYLDEMMWEIDQRARWKYARKKAVAEGRAEGRAEEKIVIAKAMKAKGWTVSEIAELTGLSLEQIESL
jgi:predicted transposase/invertase (TIGR01784 family)